MGVYVGGDECQVIYVAKNGLQLRVSSVWVGDQQVFPPANRQEIHLFTRDTQGYGREDKGTFFGFYVPIPWWATSLDVVLIGAGEKGRDGTKSFTGGSDGAGGKSGAWVVKTVALPQSPDAVVYIGKGTSTTPSATSVYLPGVGGQSDVLVHDGEGTRTPNSGSTGGSVTPRTRTEFVSYHAGGSGGSRNNPGQHPGGGGGGGQGSNLLGNPQAGRDGGDGYVWLRFRSAPALNPGDDEFILRVGVSSGSAFAPLRNWAVGIGKTYTTITEITVPLVVVGPSLYQLFYGCSALATVPEFDTSQVTNMSGMFEGCSSLVSVPAMNTGQVTNMYAMFYGCQALVSVPELNTGQVTNMYAMFQGCSSLTSVPELDTGQVTNMYAMFYGCQALVSVPAMDTSQVTNMYDMFYNCSSLTSVPELNTGQVTNMQWMFYGCSSLTTIPALDTSKVADMQYMFYNCSTLTSIPELDTSKVTNMYAMFQGCSSLTSVPELDTGQVTNMYAMFQGCSSLTSVPAMNTGQVTNMYAMFFDCSSLTSVPAMNTGQVTNMRSMFEGCSSLTTVPELNTSQVTTMENMFYGCTSLTTIPELDSGQVTNMYALFAYCSSLTTIPALDTSKVTNMEYMFYDCSSLESVTLPGMGNGFTAKQTLDMGATKLNAAAANALMQSLGTVPAAAAGSTLQLPSTAAGADTSIAASKNWTVTIEGGSFILRVGVSSGVAYAPLREWAVSIGKTYQTITKITVPMEAIGSSLESLFRDCSSLTTIPALDTSQVTNVYAMFYGCSSLTSVPAMNTSQATNMQSLFHNCSSLTSVPAMNTSQATNMYAMFYGCTALTSVPALDTSKATNPDFMFGLCSALESVTLPGMGNSFPTKRTLDMKPTKLNAAAANALMQSLGAPAPGGTLQLPATAAGADTSIAASKNWTVTIG